MRTGNEINHQRNMILIQLLIGIIILQFTERSWWGMATVFTQDLSTRKNVKTRIIKYVLLVYSKFVYITAVLLRRGDCRLVEDMRLCQGGVVRLLIPSFLWSWITYLLCIMLGCNHNLGRCRAADEAHSVVDGDDSDEEKKLFKLMR